jgi:septum formation protein
MYKSDRHPENDTPQQADDRRREDRREAVRDTVGKPIILGSASRWRAKVLKDSGVPFTVMATDIDEKAIREVSPYQLTLRVARTRAEALLPLISAPAFLATADQVILFRGEIREKPVDAAQAREWLSQYRGCAVQAITAVFVIDVLSGITAAGHDTATVSFGLYPDSVIDALLSDPDAGVFRSCGALIHEHPAIAPFALCFHQEDDVFLVPSIHVLIHGSDPDALTGVSGLPLNLTLRLLARVGWKKEG